MRRNLLVILTGLIIMILLSFTGCAKKTEIKTGKYYLENSDSVYIEILDDKNIQFVNYDFTRLKEILVGLQIEFDEDELDQYLAQVHEYTVENENEILWYLRYSLAIGFNYSDSGILTQGSKTYILRTE